MSLKTCVRVVTLGAGMYEQRKLVEGRREGKCKDVNRKIKKKKKKINNHTPKFIPIIASANYG